MDRKDWEKIRQQVQPFLGSTLKLLELRPVDDVDVQQIFESESSCTPPYSFPVLKHLSGRTYSLCVRPGRRPELCEWMSTSTSGPPSLVASRMRYLPGVLFPSLCGSRANQVWPEILALSEQMPDGYKLDLRWYIDRDLPPEKYSALLDPEDSATLLMADLNACGTMGEARKRIEARGSAKDASVWARYVLALKRSEESKAKAVAAAEAALKCEILWDTGLRNNWFENVQSIRMIIPWLVRLVLSGSKRREWAPLEPCRKKMSERALAEALLEVSRLFQKKSDTVIALNLARTAAMLATFSETLTPAMCLYIAELSDQLEPRGLAGEVARYAAQFYPANG